MFSRLPKCNWPFCLYYWLQVRNLPNLFLVSSLTKNVKLKCSCHTSVTQRLQIFVEMASKDIMNSDRLHRNLQTLGERLRLEKPRWRIGKGADWRTGLHSTGLLLRACDCATRWTVSFALCQSLRSDTFCALQSSPTWRPRKKKKRGVLALNMGPAMGRKGHTAWCQWDSGAKSILMILHETARIITSKLCSLQQLIKMLQI